MAKKGPSVGTAPKRARAARAHAASSATEPGSGTLRRLKDTVVTTLAGVLDVGSEVGAVAVSAARGTIRAAGEIGADVGRVALRAAGGALQAADRISAAAGRAIIAPKMVGAGPAPGRPVVATERSTSAGRKPLARSSSRPGQPTARRRGRKTA
ncbi:MAG TPA: hypothetical protein VIG07_20245 [Methylomirabilota bacterium]|jgi:hypothetical protein